MWPSTDALRRFTDQAEVHESNAEEFESQMEEAAGAGGDPRRGQEDAGSTALPVHVDAGNTAPLFKHY